MGVFPNPAALLRLAGAVLVEQHDEWEAGDRRYFSEASMRELEAMKNPNREVEVMPEITAAQSETIGPHGAEKLHHSAGRHHPKPADTSGENGYRLAHIRKRVARIGANVSYPLSPGWFPDPTTAFEFRYWDGASWTSHVSTNGVQSVSTPPPGLGSANDPGFSPQEPAEIEQQIARPAADEPTRRRKPMIAAAAAACAAVLLSLLLVEYNSEKSALSEYRLVADRESTNRDAVLKQYQARDRALREVVDVQHDIDAVHSTMKKSDCYTVDPCDGAEEWNKNNDRLEKLFKQSTSLERSNQTAVNKIHKVAEPDELWLLSLLGKNDSGETQATLDDYLPKIRLAKNSINQNISAINRWNSDCVPDDAIECDAEAISLETES